MEDRQCEVSVRLVEPKCFESVRDKGEALVEKHSN